MSLMKKLLALLAASPLTAFAATTAPAGHPNPLIQFAPLVLIVVLLYFMMIRPQMKRGKETKNMLANLGPGDEVVTTGGILGKINSVGDSFVELSINDSTSVKVQKNAITNVVPKGSVKSA